MKVQNELHCVYFLFTFIARTEVISNYLDRKQNHILGNNFNFDRMFLIQMLDSLRILEIH